MKPMRQRTGRNRLGRLGCSSILVISLCRGMAAPDPPPQEAAPAAEKVALKWAFGALVGGPESEKLEAIVRDRVLHTGDQFKMMVELEKLCFVYLVYHSADGELNLLFPYDLRQLDADYTTGRRYYIPKGSSWFELDSHAGDETFFLVASPERLRDLESLLARYESSGPGAKADLKRQILENLRVLRRQRRELAAPAERPVTIGGTVRGQGKTPGGGRPDVATIAEEIRSGGIVVRTFTVEHK